MMVMQHGVHGMQRILRRVECPFLAQRLRERGMLVISLTFFPLFFLFFFLGRSVGPRSDQTTVHEDGSGGARGQERVGNVRCSETRGWVVRRGRWD